jgi:hypothetical protein
MIRAARLDRLDAGQQSTATPVRAFGLAAVDAGEFDEHLRVTLTTASGAAETIPIPHLVDELAANASVFFVGITTDTPFTRLHIENSPVSSGTPYIAFDEFVVPLPAPAPSPLLPAIPEPHLSILWLAGIACLMLARHRRAAGAAAKPRTKSAA